MKTYLVAAALIVVLYSTSTSLNAQQGLNGTAFNMNGVQIPTDALGNPGGNPITKQKRDLGRLLFWDAQMSADNSVACGSCHLIANGAGANPFKNAVEPGLDNIFGTLDDNNGGFGVVDMDGSQDYQDHAIFRTARQVTRFSPPTMINAAFYRRVLWQLTGAPATFTDLPGATVLANFASLESQAAGPPQNAVEMGHSGITTVAQWAALEAKIATTTAIRLSPDRLNVAAHAPSLVVTPTTLYPALFQQAFGTAVVTRERIAMAIATYERTLISNQAPFDRFLAGNQTAISLSAERGFNIFRKSGCINCHATDANGNFSNGLAVPFVYPAPFNLLAVGTPDPLDGLLSDGRLHNINLQGHNLSVKTPSLRNIELKNRIFHSGQLPGGLNNIVNFYNTAQPVGPAFRWQDPVVGGPLTTAQDFQAVTDFLRALTDPRVANETGDFSHPRLHSELNPSPAVEFGLETMGVAGVVDPIAVAPATSFNSIFKIGVGNTIPNAQLFIGISTVKLVPPTFLGLIPVNVDIFNPANGSLAAVTTATWTGLLPGQGTATMPVIIPPAAFIGQLHFQWFVRDIAAPGGIAASKGVTLDIF